MGLKDIDSLIKNARFDLTPEELERFKVDFAAYLESIKALYKLDVIDTQIAMRPFYTVNGTDRLRSDDVIANNAGRVLEQANKSQGNYIILEEDGNE